MNHPRSAFGAPPRGGASGGPAKPDPRRPLDGSIHASRVPLFGVMEFATSPRVGASGGPAKPDPRGPLDGSVHASRVPLFGAMEN